MQEESGREGGAGDTGHERIKERRVGQDREQRERGGGDNDKVKKVWMMLPEGPGREDPGEGCGGAEEEKGHDEAPLSIHPN